MNAAAPMTSSATTRHGSQTRAAAAESEAPPLTPPSTSASLSSSSSLARGPPHWGVCLHPSVFRVDVTGRDVLYNLHSNGTLRYYYHLLSATAASAATTPTAPPSSTCTNDVPALQTSRVGPTLPAPVEATMDTPKDSLTEDHPSLPDPALTQRVVQRCLRQTIPQIVSFRYTVHSAHHVPSASTATHASNTGEGGDGGGGGDAGAGGGSSRASPALAPRRSDVRDQLVGQMRSSRLNSIEALLPKHSPFAPIPIERTQFPLSEAEEKTREMTVRALLSEPLCRQVAVSLERQLYEARVEQRHRGRLFTYRAVEAHQDPTSVYTGTVLDLVVGAGERTGLFHSPLISGLEVALASMMLGETAGFFMSAPQTFAYTSTELGLAVPIVPHTSSSSRADQAETARYNAAVPALVRRGVDRVLYYTIQLIRRAPAVFAFPPCRGLTLYTVPPMAVQLAHRHGLRPGSVSGGGGGVDPRLRLLHEHDVESIHRLRAAAKCNPYSFFLFTNLSRVGRELPVATFCQIDPNSYLREAEASAALSKAAKKEDDEVTKLRQLRARQLAAAEVNIQIALLSHPEKTAAAAHRAFAMAVSMVMGSTTLFDADDVDGSDEATTTTTTSPRASVVLTSSLPPSRSSEGFRKSASVDSLRAVPSPSPAPAHSPLQTNVSTSTSGMTEVHGLLTHTLEAAMIEFGQSSTAAAMRDAVTAALSSQTTPNTSPHLSPTRSEMAPIPMAALSANHTDATRGVVHEVGGLMNTPNNHTLLPSSVPSSVAHHTPFQSAPAKSAPKRTTATATPTTTPTYTTTPIAAKRAGGSAQRPSTMQDTPKSISGELARRHRSKHGGSDVLAVEYERWLTDACRYLDTRFLPCPRGAAVVQLRLSRYVPVTEQYYDLLLPCETGPSANGAATPSTSQTHPAAAAAGTLTTPVCSLAIPCWLSLALTQQLHRASSAQVTEPHYTAGATATPPSAPSDRAFCVSSVRVEAPVGLPMDQSDEEAFMMHLFHQLRQHTTSAYEVCRQHLDEQLEELAVGHGMCTEATAANGDDDDGAGQPCSRPVLPPASTVEASTASVKHDTPTTMKASSAPMKLAGKRAEVVLSAYPNEERNMANAALAATTTTTTAAAKATSASGNATRGPSPEASTSSLLPRAASAVGGCSAAVNSATPASSVTPTMEEQYHVESRIISPTPALRKRHFFFLNPKTSLTQVRALLSRVCTLLHIYDIRNPYRRGAARVWQAPSSLSSSMTSSRQPLHYSVLSEDSMSLGDRTPARQFSSPLAGVSTSPTLHAWQTHNGEGEGSSQTARRRHGAPPPPHPALAGWAPIESQCAKLTTRLDKVTEIPEHEKMVDELLLGPTACAQSVPCGSPPEQAKESVEPSTTTTPPRTTTSGADASPSTVPMRTWSNVLASATFFSTDEHGRLLPEQREKAVLRRCLFKVFELAYLAIVLLTFGTEESQLRPSWFLARGGYGAYFAAPPPPPPSAATTPIGVTVRVDDLTDMGAAVCGHRHPLAAPEARLSGSRSCLEQSSGSPRLPSIRSSSTADLLAASMAASTSLNTPAAALRAASDNSKRRRYQYLAECYQYVALTLWELLVPYLLTPSAMLTREEKTSGDGGGRPSTVVYPISYTSSTTRKTPIANMLCECGLDAVTYALMYDPHEASLWSLRARFNTHRGLYEDAQRDIDIAKNLTAAEKAEETLLLKTKQQSDSDSNAQARPTLIKEGAVLDLLEDRLTQLDEQETQLKALRAASAGEH